jgi:hypothetical protein
LDCLKREEIGIGFDATEGNWVNTMDTGIVDPTKVIRYALQHAASVSAMFLTCCKHSTRKCWWRNAGYGRHGWNGRNDVNRRGKCCLIDFCEPVYNDFL